MRILYFLVNLMMIITRLDADLEPIKIEESKRADIKQLIVMDDQAALTKQAFEEIFHSFVKKSFEIPPDLLKEILAEIKIDQLLDELIPIYDKYLSHADIKDLLRVKNLPLDKAQSLKTKYLQQKIKIHVIWGHKIAMKIQQKLWDKNINFDMFDDLDD